MDLLSTTKYGHDPSMEMSRLIPIGSPFRASSPSGLSVELNSNGSVRRIDCGDIMLNLYLGNEAEGGPTNIYLRRLGGEVEAIPLLGPLSPASFQCHGRGMSAAGQWGDLRFRLELCLAESAKAWFWHVEVENTGKTSVKVDLIHTQDLSIANYGAIRLNEFYVSQYVDHCPLEHGRVGTVVASRQNQSMGGRCPWTVIGSLGRGTSYATDALQFHGFSRRDGCQSPGLEMGLPGQRLQHEHSMVCIQDEPVVLPPGEKTKRGFFGWFEPDNPAATGPDDVRFVDSALALPEAVAAEGGGEVGTANQPSGLFATARLLETVELNEDEINRHFGEERRHLEYDEGHLWSFFNGHGGHVVLGGKERGVLRPHGHLLRTGASLVADESSLTSTVWMGGVFHSMVTQGHVSINRFLSTCHSYLGLFRSHGLRVFAEINGEWQLLHVPSAFEMELDSCRWIYRHPGGVIEVVSSARTDRHELGLSLSVTEGEACRFLVSHHVALNGDDGSTSGPALWERREEGVFVRAIPDSDVGRRFPDGGFFVRFGKGTAIEMIGGDELLFADKASRNQPYLCLVIGGSTRVELFIEGRLLEPSGALDASFWDSISSGLRIGTPGGAGLPESAHRMGEIFPWLIHNALVHYLSPRGLEQYSGGGWGTRDVCQGPVELLLALGRFAPVRDLLLHVFRQQNADGDWPQWFMFFDRERNIRPGDSHGDIVYWPLLALAEYVSATGDKGILDESLPFFHTDGDAAEYATIRVHLNRALDLIRRRVIPGTVLAAYGHGDWNDSLQPAKPEMRERLCSSWTVTLNYQTLRALAQAFESIGESESAKGFNGMAETVLREFQQVLIGDDVLAGLAYFHEDGNKEYLLHPTDKRTGLSYSLLPMIHAIINDMLSPEQAEMHLKVIQTHLLGPDGARLFDRPMEYHGGIQRYFQRAESASFFGREIGIMYTHAHLRFCECLARLGKAEAFFHALCQMNPILIREVVQSAAPRQANCYYSSSDAAFADRYLAFDEYAKVNRGEVPLEGGWRVYSSGAGISVRLIVQCFLGLRAEAASLIIDPVMPLELDGLDVELVLAGHAIKICYRVTKDGCGPRSIELNGTTLGFERESNPYRCGGVRIPLAEFKAGLGGVDDRLTVWLD